MNTPQKCPLCGKNGQTLVEYSVKVERWNKQVRSCVSCRFWLTRQVKGLVEK